MLGPWYTEHEGGQGLGEVCQESWVVEEGGDGAEPTYKVWWIATLFIGFFTHLFFETVPEAPKRYRWAVKRTVVNFDRNAFRAVN